MTKRAYILYDERAIGGDTDEASVLEAWGPRETSPPLYHWQGHHAVLYSYAVIDGNTLVDERVEKIL